jgi:broad specificity phosphatase PhoE
MGPAARVVLWALAVAAVLPPAGSGLGQEDAWAVLQRPGHVAFMRHAATSGGAGDPPGFKLEDCATQRNLTDEGRAQAIRTGEALRARGIAFQRILTSPWCRCRETARLLAGIDAEVMDALSNLVGRSEHRAEQVQAIRAYLAGLDPSTRVLFVTHGIVIAAVTGRNPAEGEMVVVRVDAGGEPSIAGRLKVE